MNRLGRGVNVGGVFDRRSADAPAWPHRDDELAAIAAAGFTHVRLPVRWWGHADDVPPHRLDPEFAHEVDLAIDRALHIGLAVVLSMHHADGVMSALPAGVTRVCALWRQIAARYADRAPELAFDLLNEPRDELTPERWNRVLPAVLRAVRDVDDRRTVIIGGAQMGTLPGLLELEPPTDERLILTLHYYEPFAFTHQAAPWEPGSRAWSGTRWGSPSDRRAVTADLEAAARWAEARGLPLYVGEFGAFQAAPQSDRVAWTTWVRRELDRLELSWAYWDFATDFGIYDREQGRWRTGLLDALIAPGDGPRTSGRPGG